MLKTAEEVRIKVDDEPAFEGMFDSAGNNFVLLTEAICANDQETDFKVPQHELENRYRAAVARRDNPEELWAISRSQTIAMIDGLGDNLENGGKDITDDPAIQADIEALLKRLDTDKALEDDFYAASELNASYNGNETIHDLLRAWELYYGLSEGFGVELDHLPAETAKQLVEYVCTVKNKDFQKLHATTQRLSPEAKGRFAEAFLATEFGDDFGNRLLAIAEHASGEQTEKIVDIVASFRQHSKQMAEWFSAYDPQLTSAFNQALNERFTDSLVALEALAVNGTLHVDVSPGRNAEGYQSDGRFDVQLNSLDEGIEIFGSLEKSINLITSVVTDPENTVHRVNKTNEHFSLYRFMSPAHGDALLYVRPEGAKGYDPAIEYGNRAGVEASISFIANPTNPHHLDIYKDPQGVSIRIDREGRTVDESPFSADRDPTRPGGSVSVDISSLMGDGRHTPVKVGRLVAAGNLLRAQQGFGKESLHHNNNYFEQETYGSAEGFSKLAIYIMLMAEAMIAVQKNGTNGAQYATLPGKLQRVAETLAA